MASLYHRAAKRCELNILRRYPAWRQAHLTEADRPLFEAWKAANTEHLQALRGAIVEGDEPDIDRGWPDPEAALIVGVDIASGPDETARAVWDPESQGFVCARDPGLDSALEIMARAKADIDRVTGMKALESLGRIPKRAEQPPDPEPEPAQEVPRPDYTFNPLYVMEQQREGEAPADTDRRLTQEFEELEAARPLDPEREARRKELLRNFHEGKG